MNTFLPYQDFQKSAWCLDDQRLPNQCYEAEIILKTLEGKLSGWKNHPAVKMWEGYSPALIKYHNECAIACTHRRLREVSFLEEPKEIIYPEWLGDRLFHETMQGNLLRKDYSWYIQFGWGVNTTYGYIWPYKSDGIWVYRDLRKKLEIPKEYLV